jgi:hypothetical protein
MCALHSSELAETHSKHGNGHVENLGSKILKICETETQYLNSYKHAKPHKNAATVK